MLQEVRFVDICKRHCHSERKIGKKIPRIDKIR